MTTRQIDPGDGLGSRIREARLDANLTQRELAARVGVNVHTVWCWEEGRRTPGEEHLGKIAFHCEAAKQGRAGAAAGKRKAPVTMPREERMRAVVGVIVRHAAKHGYPPSMQEIMDETGFGSKSVVASSLDACERAGLIVRARRAARAVTLTDAGRAFAEAPSETGGLPVRREEPVPSAPRAEAAATTGQSDAGSGMAAGIREARCSAGLTQRELAALVGVSLHTVWCWEADRMRPTHEHRVEVAFHCGTDVGALEGRTASAGDALQETAAAFRDAVAHLPKRDIEFIWTFIGYVRWRHRMRRRAGK